MIRLPIVVLIAGFLILAIGNGSRFSQGLFLAPMTGDLGWSFQVFSLAIAIQHFLTGLFQPFAGMVADRFGTARVIAGGMLIYALGLVWMANVEAPVELYFGSAVLIALGLSGAGISIVLAAVARVFPAERRSFVLGITTAGASAGQFAFSPLSQALIGWQSWSGALVIIAGIAAVASLLAVALRTPASDTGESVAALEQTVVQAVGEASRHSGFIYLSLGFFVCGFHVTLIMTHLPAFAVVCGLSPMVGASALSLIGLFNIIGTNVAGWLGDRYRKKYLLSGLYFSRAVVFSLYLAFPVTETSTLLFAGTMGLLWLSTVPLTSSLVGQIFGVRYLGTLFGIVFFSHQVGAFFGAWLGGFVYDTTGSYDLMWYAAIGLGLFAAVVHWPITDAPVERRAAAPA